MSNLLHERLGRIVDSENQSVLIGGLKGIEKESLRITTDGRIAHTPHPDELGSALTNRFITTDYSEALLEFVTPAFPHMWEALQCLCEIHNFVYDNIGDELLWATSMPCVVAGDDDVPIAHYGQSNVGKMKTVYRRGLGYRYSRKMQAISGVHFNYSLPEAFWPVYAGLEGHTGDIRSVMDDGYFSLLRNFRRFGWIVLYLFGASPAICKSFLSNGDGEAETDLDELTPGTVYLPYATSLRMSDIGYKNKSQSTVNISVNSIDEYISDLTHAITTPNPAYESIGVRVDGRYRQINANLLQIENEYYGFIRPKRVTKSGERPTVALQRSGVEYVEVRALDVSPIDPIGVNQNQLRFLEAFLIWCLLRESPGINEAEQSEIDHNQSVAARHGRDPDLSLYCFGERRLLREWAAEIISDMQQLCSIMDEAAGDTRFSDALARQKASVDDAALTPSSRILKELRSSGDSFYAFAMRMSQEYKQYFEDLAVVDDARMEQLKQEASSSLVMQREIEANDSMSFEAYLEQYFA